MNRFRYLFVGLVILSLLSLLFPQELDVGFQIAEPLSLGAAAIMGGASLLSGVANLFGQSSANETNKLIAKENRDWQSEENQKNRDYSERMWNLQNAYNTPEAMMKRYDEAGLNPYLIGSNGGSGIGAAGAASSPASVGAPNQPNIQPLNFNGIGNAVDRAFSLMLQSKQVQSNTEMQHAESIQKFVESYAEVYKTGGKKQADSFVKAFLPLLGDFDESKSPIGQMMRSQRYNIDMQSLNEEFAYDTNKEWTQKEKQQKFNLLKTENEKLFSEIALMFTQENLNRASQKELLERCKTYASQIAKNFAEAFQAQKIGGYYQVSAEQMQFIKKMTEMEFEDAKADFEFNEPIRVAKRDKGDTSRNDNFSNWSQGLVMQGKRLDREGNDIIWYGNQVSNMVGNVFKVNAGVSKSTSRGNINVNSRSYGEFNNVTPHPTYTPISGF